MMVNVAATVGIVSGGRALGLPWHLHLTSPEVLQLERADRRHIPWGDIDDAARRPRTAASPLRRDRTRPASITRSNYLPSSYDQSPVSLRTRSAMLIATGLPHIVSRRLIYA